MATPPVRNGSAGGKGTLTLSALLGRQRDPLDPFRLDRKRPIQDFVECHALLGRRRSVETVMTRRGSKEIDEGEDEEQGEDEEGGKEDEEAAAALRSFVRREQVSKAQSQVSGTPDRRRTLILSFCRAADENSQPSS